jgi:cytochrome c553
MASIAKRLTDRDIEAIALYFAAVRTGDEPPRMTGVVR